MPERAIGITDGGLATSGQGRRRWLTTAGPAHHLIDPRTGRSADTGWWAVSALAASATAANVAATAGMLLDGEAPAWFAERGLHGLFTRWSGSGRATAHTVGQWPEMRGGSMSEVPWTWFVMRSSGLVAVGLLTVSVLLGLVGPRLRPTARLTSISVHRAASVAGTLLIVAHIILALLDKWIVLDWPAALLPGVASWERWGVALGALGRGPPDRRPGHDGHPDAHPAGVAPRASPGLPRVGTGRGAWTARRHRWCGHAGPGDGQRRGRPVRPVDPGPRPSHGASRLCGPNWSGRGSCDDRATLTGRSLQCRDLGDARSGSPTGPRPARTGPSGAAPRPAPQGAARPRDPAPGRGGARPPREPGRSTGVLGVRPRPGHR